MASLINTVLLHGNLTDAPYYDLVEGSDTPFLRFYLAASLPRDLAWVALKGNVVQPPYYAQVGDEGRPFLRLNLAVDRPHTRRQPWERRGGQDRQTTDYLRVVAYDDAALFSHGYLRPGSEVVVGGNLRMRRRNGKKIEVEVVTRDIVFVDKIDWAQGDTARDALLTQQGDGESDGPSSEVMGGGRFRVVCFGALARSCYGYLRAGSEVFVRGRLQARKRKPAPGKSKGQTVVEVVAESVRFLSGIDEQAGRAAQAMWAQQAGEAGEVQA